MDNHSQQYADQYLGCIACRENHHITSFCKKCQSCFYCMIQEDKDKKLSKNKWRVQFGEYIIVSCQCGCQTLWD